MKDTANGPAILSVLKKRGRGLSVHVLAQEREELLQACIREFYLTPERPSLAALGREVRRRFAERQLSPPHYRTIQRRVEGLDLGLAIAKREGAKRAREKCGPVGVSSLGADLPMDLVQIDHTLMDVVHAISGGRAFRQTVRTC